MTVQIVHKLLKSTVYKIHLTIMLILKVKATLFFKQNCASKLELIKKLFLCVIQEKSILSFDQVLQQQIEYTYEILIQFLHKTKTKKCHYLFSRVSDMLQFHVHVTINNNFILRNVCYFLLACLK